MSELKTKRNDANVLEFLNSVEHPRRREDGLALLDLFAEVTDLKPEMWGDSIVGYGAYHYKSKSGQEGDWFLAGFSPRKQRLSVYVMAGFEKFEDLLAKLGKHKTGVGCLYINKLADVDRELLKALIARSIDEMKESEHS